MKKNRLAPMLAFARVNDAAGTIGKITLEGEILPSEWSLWSDGTANTPQLMREQLAALGDVERIQLHINSPGGSVTDGIAIMNALAQHAAPVSVYVDGVAASIASVIVMAADPGEIHMPTNTLLFAHLPWTYTMGNSEELLKDVERLQKMEEVIVASYRRHTEKSEADLLDMMKAETWLTAAECADLFGANVIDEPMQIAAGVDLSKLGDNVPDAAKAWGLADDDGQGGDNAGDNATGNDAGQDDAQDGGQADGDDAGQDGDDAGQDDGGADGDGADQGQDAGGQDDGSGGDSDGSDGAAVDNPDGQADGDDAGQDAGDGAGDDGQDGNDNSDDGTSGGDAGAPTSDTVGDQSDGGDNDAPDTDGDGADNQADNGTPPDANHIASLQKKDPHKLAAFINGVISARDKAKAKLEALRADMRSLTGAHETQIAALNAQHAEALEAAKTEAAAEHAEEIATLKETNQAMKAKLDTLTTGGFTFHGSVDSWDDAVTQCGGGEDGYVKARKAYPALYAEYMRQAALKTGKDS